MSLITNVYQFFEKIEKKEYMCDFCQIIVTEQDCFEHRFLHNKCSFLIYNLETFYKCKLCNNFEFYLDLGDHLYSVHNIINENFLENLTNVFFDLNEYGFFKFVSKVQSKGALYDCFICKRKKFRHIFRHFSKNHKDVKINDNFYQKSNMSLFKCKFCKDIFLKENFYEHFKNKHKCVINENIFFK